jgi:hypothetical protein
MSELGRGVLVGGGSALGAGLGAAAGPVGGVFGGAAGGTAGSAIADVLGLGDYTIRQNSLLLDEGMQVASFGDMNHAVMISHREYIGDITIPATPAAFTIQSFPINPGIPKTFPWLNAISACFDQYEICGMLFHYKSTSSDFGTTTSLAMGTVIMATDYDSADANFGSKLEMENAQYSTSCKPSSDCIHAIECDPSLTFAPVKYIRSTDVPNSKDIRLYDQGNFQLATVGLPTGSSGTIGELWVTYQIKFFKPQLNSATSALTQVATAATWDGTARWGLGLAITAGSSLNISYAGNTVTFGANITPGMYILQVYQVAFPSAAITSTLLYTAVGCTSVDGGRFTTNTVTQYSEWNLWKVTANGATITLSNSSVPASQTRIANYWTVIDTDVGIAIAP